MFKKKKTNVFRMKHASLVRIVLSQSVIIGPVNCTHAFNCWTVSVAACKHAAQQLVTVLQALTSCLWACYWPETVISLSLPATPQRCRETDFAFLLPLTQSQSSICPRSAVKGGSRVLCDVKKLFWDGGGTKIRRSKSFWSPALGSAESFSLSEIRGNDSSAAITASKHKHHHVFLSVGWIDGYLPVWKFGLNKSHLLWQCVSVRNVLEITAVTDAGPPSLSHYNISAFISSILAGVC